MFGYPNKSRLNILISSTTQWNPGDEFIRFGVKNLLQSYIGVDNNWLLWNRNPDLFVDAWIKPKISPLMLANSLKSPSLDIVDMVVIAGTPEWRGPSLEPVYRDLLRYSNIPLMMLGLGAGTAEVELTQAERLVMRRDNTLITARSRGLAATLNQQLGIDKVRALPCPALFCADTEDTAHMKTLPIGLILQSSSVNNQSISENLFKKILCCLESIPIDDLAYIAFYIDEFMRLTRLSDGRPVIYDFEPASYFSVLKSASWILSTRLHGAIASLAVGTPAILIAENNYRLESAQEVFGDILPLMSPEQAFGVTHTLTSDQQRAWTQKILSFKLDVRNRYHDILSQFFQTLGLLAPA